MCPVQPGRGSHPEGQQRNTEEARAEEGWSGGPVDVGFSGITATAVMCDGPAQGVPALTIPHEESCFISRGHVL